MCVYFGERKGEGGDLPLRSIAHGEDELGADEEDAGEAEDDE